MRNFREYDIWIDGMELVNEVYSLLNAFPSNEKFALSSQISRSAVSIPSNIAEGASRSSEKEFARFLEISLGSCFELETQLLIARNRNYVKGDRIDECLSKLNSLQKRINGLRSKIKYNH